MNLLLSYHQPLIDMAVVLAYTILLLCQKGSWLTLLQQHGHDHVDTAHSLNPKRRLPPNTPRFTNPTWQPLRVLRELSVENCVPPQSLTLSLINHSVVLWVLTHFYTDAGDRVSAEKSQVQRCWNARFLRGGISRKLPCSWRLPNSYDNPVVAEVLCVLCWWFTRKEAPCETLGREEDRFSQAGAIYFRGAGMDDGWLAVSTNMTLVC